MTVQAVAARQGAITRVVTGGGKLQAATEVKLSSNITGDLVDLAIREGDQVTKGQVLGHIDARRYGAQLSQAEGARNSAAADLQGARVRAAALEAEYKRVATLAAGQNASGAELEKARAELDAARATAAAAEQRLAQADAALREARHQFSLTTLTAPIDGIVTQRVKQVGERVRGSDFSEDVIMVIATLSRMEMKAEIGEHEVVYVKEGDPAEIEVDAFPERKIKAKVVEVARNATVKNAGTEQEVTTFIVRMALIDRAARRAPRHERPGRHLHRHPPDAVVVPISALTVRAEKDLKPKAAGPVGEPQAQAPPVPGKKARKELLKKVVFVVEDGAAKVRQVETGLASDTEIEITSGLKAGEKVVEGPYKALSKELADGAHGEGGAARRQGRQEGQGPVSDAAHLHRPALPATTWSAARWCGRSTASPSTSRQGEWVAIVGQSGSGKSTLMNLLGCLDTATSGTYRLNGADVETLTDDQLADLRNKEIGFVFQTFQLLPRATRARQRGAAAGLPRRAAAGAAGPGRAGAPLGGARQPDAPQAQRALRRPAPARGGGPRPGGPAVAAPRRRADRQPRLADRRGDRAALRRAPRRAATPSSW